MPSEPQPNVTYAMQAAYAMGVPSYRTMALIFAGEGYSPAALDRLRAARVFGLYAINPRVR